MISPIAGVTCNLSAPGIGYSTISSRVGEIMSDQTGIQTLEAGPLNIARCSTKEAIWRHPWSNWCDCHRCVNSPFWNKIHCFHFSIKGECIGEDRGIDYDKLKNSGAYKEYKSETLQLQTVSLDELSENERKAFFISILQINQGLFLKHGPGS